MKKLVSFLLGLLFILAASLTPAEPKRSSSESNSCNHYYNIDYTYLGDNIWQWSRTRKCKGVEETFVSCFFYDPETDETHDVPCP